MSSQVRTVCDVLVLFLVVHGSRLTVRNGRVERLAVVRHALVLGDIASGKVRYLLNVAHLALERLRLVVTLHEVAQGAHAEAEEDDAAASDANDGTSA